MAATKTGGSEVAAMGRSYTVVFRLSRDDPDNPSKDITG